MHGVQHRFRQVAAKVLHVVADSHLGGVRWFRARPPHGCGDREVRAVVPRSTGPRMRKCKPRSFPVALPAGGSVIGVRRETASGATVFALAVFDDRV